MQGLSDLPPLRSPGSSIQPQSAFTPSKSTDDDPDQLLSPADPNLRCAICHQLFSQPQRTACGHVFCNACLKTWLPLKGNCPECRAPVEPGTPTPDRFAERLVDNLQGFCQLKSAGCTWVGRRGDMPSHLANECRCVIVFCPHEGCEREMPRHALEAHLQSCPRAPEQLAHCPYGCGTRCSVDALEEHKTTCLLDPLKLVAAVRSVRCFGVFARFYSSAQTMFARAPHLASQPTDRPVSFLYAAGWRERDPRTRE